MQTRDRKKLLERHNYKLLVYLCCPPTSFFLARGWIRRSAPLLEEAVEDMEEGEGNAEAEEVIKEIEEAEEVIDDPFVPPLPTAPAALLVSRAGRKRALTMKALEAEKAPKQGTEPGKASGVVEAGGQRDRADVQYQVSCIYFLIKR
jgi:hypothetical protein